MGSGLPFTSFLSEGTRQSLLGPAPIPQVGLFASGPNHSLTHFLNKVHHLFFYHSESENLSGQDRFSIGYIYSTIIFFT